MSGRCSAGATSSSSGEARRFEVAGVRIALVRIGDDFYAIGDRCSHEDYSLSEGEVWVEECELECPRHGSTFDLQDRRALLAPATTPVPVFEIEVVGDDVAVVLAVTAVATGTLEDLGPARRGGRRGDPARHRPRGRRRARSTW